MSRAERGRSLHKTNTPVAIADELGVSLDDLVQGRKVKPRRGTSVARLVRLVEKLDEDTAAHAETVLRAFLRAVAEGRRRR